MAELAVGGPFLGVKPAFLRIGSAQISLVLVVRFLIRNFGRFVCDNSPIIYGDYFKVTEVDGVHNIRGIERASFVHLVAPNCMGHGCWV